MRFEGDGLQPPEAQEHVAHTHYTPLSDSRPTMPVSAADVRKSMEAMDAADLSMVPTEETEVPAPPTGYSSGDFDRRATTPIVPAPVAPTADSRRLSVTQLRVIFGSVTVAVSAWLAWVYLLRR